MKYYLALAMMAGLVAMGCRDKALEKRVEKLEALGTSQAKLNETMAEFSTTTAHALNNLADNDNLLLDVIKQVVLR